MSSYMFLTKIRYYTLSIFFKLAMKETYFFSEYSQFRSAHFCISTFLCHIFQVELNLILSGPP